MPGRRSVGYLICGRRGERPPKGIVGKASTQLTRGIRHQAQGSALVAVAEKDIPCTQCPVNLSMNAQGCAHKQAHRRALFISYRQQLVGVAIQITLRPLFHLGPHQAAFVVV